MRIGTIVENESTGCKGVVVPDFMNCCTEVETPVVYDETDFTLGTISGELKATGTYDERAASIKLCGGGAGQCTCKWLGIDADGERCLRFSDLRYDIMFRSNMVASGSPVSRFPDCQAEIQAGITASVPAGSKPVEA